eukprot:6851290-Prymnesium_polylepis.2
MSLGAATINATAVNVSMPSIGLAPPEGRRLARAGMERVCWQALNRKNFDLPANSNTLPQRCAIRYPSLESAQAACEALRADWCGAIVRDGGLKCSEGRGPQKTKFELRTNVSVSSPLAVPSWVMTMGDPAGAVASLLTSGGELASSTTQDCKSLP